MKLTKEQKEVYDSLNYEWQSVITKEKKRTLKQLVSKKLVETLTYTSIDSDLGIPKILYRKNTLRMLAG